MFYIMLQRPHMEKPVVWGGFESAKEAFDFLSPKYGDHVWVKIVRGSPKGVHINNPKRIKL